MKSSSSSAAINSHEKQTRHLQRQSTANSSRNYYFGEAKHNSNSTKQRQRANSVSSASSSSLSDPKEQMRRNGARSKDSGFRSPNQQQIYSVSSKQKKNKNYEHDEYDHHNRGAAISPTPTTGSLGQRSVKTTTTTVSAGLADRPGSRNSSATLIKQRADKKARGGSREKVSKPPSPFQKIADWFNAPAKQNKAKQAAH